MCVTLLIFYCIILKLLDVCTALFDGDAKLPPPVSLDQERHGHTQTSNNVRSRESMDNDRVPAAVAPLC